MQLGNKINREVPPSMKTSYVVVFRALSWMVKLRGECDELFWIYKRLNNIYCTPRAGQWWRVSGKGGTVFVCVGHVMAGTTKTSSLSGVGRCNYSTAYISKNDLSHARRTFIIPFSALNTARYEIFIFGWTFPLVTICNKFGLSRTWRRFRTKNLFPACMDETYCNDRQSCTFVFLSRLVGVAGKLGMSS